jgi:hypothetical protein
MLDSILQKASTGVDPHFINIWVPMHRDDLEVTQKLVSNNFNSYVCIVCFIDVKLTFCAGQIHGGAEEDTRS